jgi:prepilin-type processing-associated H-X9-DG protein
MTGAPSPDIKSELHAKGSNILFADGHVKTFPVTYFPANPVLSTAADDTNGKYFNAISGPTAYKIAVTP